jgi:hypothetical protein
MVGSAREFFVSRVLRGVLPPIIHVGAGRVVGISGMSKQIDIVLYDSRCPLLETQPGFGLFFMEGVIATIEVKSTLTRETLRLALDNCASVTSGDSCGPQLRIRYNTPPGKPRDHSHATTFPPHPPTPAPRG